MLATSPNAPTCTCVFAGKGLAVLRPLPKSAEDYYTLGVACLNAREFERAVEHLSKADRMKPHQDHIHYALAVSHCPRGEFG